MNSSLALPFTLKSAQSEDDMEQWLWEEFHSCLRLQVDTESALNGDPGTSYDPHVKAVWLGNVARNFHLRM